MISDGSGNATWSSVASVGVGSVTGTSHQTIASPTSGNVVISLTNGISLGSYQAVAPPVGGLILPAAVGIGTSAPGNLLDVRGNADLAGTVAIGTTSVSSTTQLTVSTILTGGILVGGTFGVSTGANTFGVASRPTFSVTGGSGTSYANCFEADPIFAADNTDTISIASGLYVKNSYTGNAGTITNCYGVFVDASGSLPGGSIGTSYGGYFSQPGSGTVKVALYSDNMAIGTSGTAPSANGLLVKGNATSNNFISATASVVSAAGTTVLTAASARVQFIIGITTQTFQLPDATTLSLGWEFEFNNNSTAGIVTIVNNGGSTICTIPQGGYGILICIDIGTANGTWDYHFSMPSNANYGTAGMTVTGTIRGTTSVSSPEFLVTGSSSGTISILPQAAAGTYNLNLPTTAGTSGYFLTSAGGGSSPMTWTSVSGSGAITTIDGDSGSATPSAGVVTISTGGNAGSTVNFSGTGATLTLNVTDSNRNTCIGKSAQNGSASDCTLVGYSAGAAITSASGTVAVGSGALLNLTSGAGNVAIGYQAANALTANGPGTFIGYQAGISLLTGDYNVIVGGLSGSGYTGAENSNIILGTDIAGTTGENHTLRIGNGTGTAPTQLNQAFIAGINGVTSSNAKMVTINSSTDQLGVATIPTQGIVTINGDSGSITGTTVTINGGTTGLTTSGSSTTMSLTGTLVLANGGTSASLTASNGGIFYSTASAGAILAGTATAGRLLTSGASTTPAWTTTTYPLTNAINTIMYASSANVQGSIAAANNGVLISGTGGIPSWLGAGTTGQVLVATTSNPASWGTLSSIAVTSIAGTSNQITASASTGAVTLSMPNGISIGSYQATSPPTGGIIAPGIVGLGTSTPSASSQVNINGALPYQLYINGTQTNVDGSNDAFAVNINNAFTPSGNAGYVECMEISSYFIAASTKTISYASGIHIFNETGSNVGGITQLAGIWVDTGSAATGTIGYSYGGIFKTPLATGATLTTALYADTLNVGSFTNPPANGMIIGGGITATGLGTGTGTALVLTSGNAIVALTSSERYKENIVDIADYSSNLSQLRPVLFNYINDPDKIQDAGFIAEEVAKIMPELVVYKDDQPETLRYHCFHALIINELQKALKRIEILEGKIQ